MRRPLPSFRRDWLPSRRDPARERPNPVNSIAGESVLLWLKARLGPHGYESTQPDTEDWGWYMDGSREGVHYLVGASGEPELGNGSVEWTVQIHRHRTIKDKLSGKSKLAANDALSALIERLLREIPGTTLLDVQREP